ncbi:two-component system response regulator, partial [Thalassospira xiamenensis]
MKPSLLLVEDNAQTRAQLLDILTVAEYEVTTAIDGLDALNQAQSDAFDMVVLDHKMPLMDGISLLRNLRDLTAYKNIPLVLLTTAELAVVERQAE